MKQSAKRRAIKVNRIRRTAARDKSRTITLFHGTNWSGAAGIRHTGFNASKWALISNFSSYHNPKRWNKLQKKGRIDIVGNPTLTNSRLYASDYARVKSGKVVKVVLPRRVAGQYIQRAFNHPLKRYGYKTSAKYARVYSVHTPIPKEYIR
jgi:hypothetical protein